MSGRPVLVICGIDMAMVDALRGLTNGSAEMIVIDDPLNATTEELRKDFGKFARTIDFEKLPAARAPVEHKGPQPRTKYPRRR